MLTVGADHLERCGIAWPNPAMWNNPVFVTNDEAAIADVQFLHQSSTSLVGSSPTKVLPTAPPPTPTTNIDAATEDDRSCYDLIGAQSGSLHDSALLHNHEDEQFTEHTDNVHYGSAARHSPYHRLDQLAQAAAEDEHHGQSSTPICSMLPPPLPSSWLAANRASMPPHLRRSDLSDSLVDGPAISRQGSNKTDISMHLGCDSFPTCINEDDSGRTYHNQLSSPAQIVRSKKVMGQSPRS